ncbi:hypothetical protein H257_08139 [Aphanomyces astaci]|uniref:Tc1-like transposase DDE domain-containing protein n=1 Tax=Aphanomyces astaci TaxID=112090 RepID=W4GI93_APHAT|nr:hypothetical protein H257_08139 [Aphanomyces astaci]ETV78648.1 hypothetical protein H257_08139 [Aphanomyces astaci]|eukprot:XP_009832229.1 hypothetical protein H257_08139 [Aphanomyces astaci]
MDNLRVKRELSYETKMEVIAHLLRFAENGKLATAAEIRLHRTTVCKIWRAFRRNARMPLSRPGRVGPKSLYSTDYVALVSGVPEDQRTTLRDLSVATGLTLGTLHRKLRDGTIQRKSSRIKPLLTINNMVERVAFCKWFNADKDRRKVYLVKGQTIGRRVAKSKKFIPKFMFLAAVARPRYGPEEGVSFDGKIGMWPIVKYVPAVRNSRNRPAGTLVTTLVNVDAVVYRDYVITRVIPAIKACFPSANNRVVLQHDNASLHRSITDEVLACMSTDGWKFVVRRQPPNSPDLNVLYLGFFASIQSLQYKSRSIDDVIRSTLPAFQALSSDKLDNEFVTFQAVMRLVLEHKGDNHFRLPYLTKDALRRAGTPMVNVTSPASLLE